MDMDVSEARLGLGTGASALSNSIQYQNKHRVLSDALSNGENSPRPGGRAQIDPAGRQQVRWTVQGGRQ